MESISIFKNKYKKDEKHPDYKVSIKTEKGFEDYGALWIRKTKNGETFLAGKIGKSEYKPTNKNTEQINLEDINFS
jgi:uncharacterized protein (DUF736 family)